jgi:DNA-binding NtrC family response regulator
MLRDLPGVLFVDDEQPILSMLKRLFTVAPEACEMVFELSSSRALELIKSRRFEVVVSDFNMPGFTGDLVLASAATLQPHARRIMMTSSPVDLEQSHAHCIVSKPCEVPVLRNVIRTALHSTCNEFASWSLGRSG